jgi:membrane protease YdiL (CAAX protease family)
VTTHQDQAAPARTDGEWDDLWRPSHWLDRPGHPRDARAPLLALAALVLYANVIVNEVLGPPWYLPFNLGILLVAIFVARHAGTTWTELGMRRDTVARGLVVGGAVALVVVAAIVIAALMPWARDVFEDERIVEGSLGLSLYHALVRIPIGTALYEEVLFRGVVFGMLSRRFSVLVAAIGSSALFGVWHVLPALDAIETNPLGQAMGGFVAPVLAAMLSTAVVGMGFVWLRLYARSIVAPILVHVAANSTAVLVATVVVHVL